MSNLFGVDLQPLITKVSEFTEQQKILIALIKENNSIQQKNSLVLEEIKQILQKK